ncbi:MAG: GGDEF domain-containing protein, partial [bacterium]
GGISVTFDIHDIEKEVRRNFYAITFLAIFTTAGLVGLVYLFTSKFYRQLNEAREKMEVLAITDELTGLYNRRHLLARFEEEFRRAKRLNNQLGFIIIDLDHFKKVNDRFGHLAGDEVLKALAASVKESIRSYDILGRLGGEEFLVILPDTGFEETRRFAERLRTRVKHRFDRESVLPEKVPVTISLGITVIHPDDESIGDILRRADAGLYRAKTGGRDRVGSVRS